LENSDIYRIMELLGESDDLCWDLRGMEEKDLSSRMLQLWQEFVT
jgi:hypothetical protein